MSGSELVRWRSGQFVAGCESLGLAVAGTLGSRLCPAVLQVAGEGLLGAGARVGLGGLLPDTGREEEGASAAPRLPQLLPGDAGPGVMQTTVQACPLLANGACVCLKVKPVLRVWAFLIREFAPGLWIWDRFRSRRGGGARTRAPLARGCSPVANPEQRHLET